MYEMFTENTCVMGAAHLMLRELLLDEIDFSYDNVPLRPYFARVFFTHFKQYIIDMFNTFHLVPFCAFVVRPVKADVDAAEEPDGLLEAASREVMVPVALPLNYYATGGFYKTLDPDTKQIRIRPGPGLESIFAPYEIHVVKDPSAVETMDEKFTSPCGKLLSSYRDLRKAEQVFMQCAYSLALPPLLIKTERVSGDLAHQLEVSREEYEARHPDPSRDRNPEASTTSKSVLQRLVREGVDSGRLIDADEMLKVIHPGFDTVANPPRPQCIIDLVRAHEEWENRVALVFNIPVNFLRPTVGSKNIAAVSDQDRKSLRENAHFRSSTLTHAFKQAWCILYPADAWHKVLLHIPVSSNITVNELAVLMELGVVSRDTIQREVVKLHHLNHDHHENSTKRKEDAQF